MPDAWTLVTPDGVVALNRSFSAPQYEPGGVDANAAVRRDGRVTYQRSGDGLRTPGPLRLQGRVWSDAQDIPSMVAELEEIRDAVAACTSVVRTTNAGTYTYGQLAGGPTPEVTPDGLGGFEVEIELWPGRAAPSFVPVDPGPEPEPECDTAAFLPWYETAEALTPSKEERVEAFTRQGDSQGSFATPEGFISAGGQVLGTPSGGAVIVSVVGAAWRYEGGSQAWAHTNFSADFLCAAQLPDDSTIIPIETWNGSTYQVQLTKITLAGDDSVLATLTPSDVSVIAEDENFEHGKPISCALSSDNSVLHVLFASTDDSSSQCALVGISTNSWEVLWQYDTGNVRVSDDFPEVRRIPGTDDLIIVGVDASKLPTVEPVAARLTFSSGVSAAPTQSWLESVQVAAAAPIGLAVDSANAYVLCDAGAIVVALSLSDGSGAWTYTPPGANPSAQKRSIAVLDDPFGSRLMVGIINDEELFPTELWGLVMLRDTGSSMIIGEFPLETYSLGPIGIGCVASGDGQAN